MYLKHPIQHVIPKKGEARRVLSALADHPLIKPTMGALVRWITGVDGRSATGLISQGFNQRRRSAGLQFPEIKKAGTSIPNATSIAHDPATKPGIEIRPG